MGAIPHTDLERIKRFCAEESPAKVADQVRVVYKVRGKSVTISESRAWDGPGDGMDRSTFRQLRYSPESNKWSLHWADRNSRWHPYDFIEPGKVAFMLAEIKRDPTCIFWG